MKYVPSLEWQRTAYHIYVQRSKRYEFVATRFNFIYSLKLFERQKWEALSKKQTLIIPYKA